MKKQLLSFVFIVLALTIHAQQWIAKSYNYDSIPNIKYGTAVNFNNVVDTLKMDIYSPICNDTNSISRRPLMMIIHGGSFLAGTRYDTRIIALTRDFAKRGYVTATIEYRLGFVADNNTHNCNYPSYSCFFAADSMEWHRSAYRAMQDAKGALRFLVNRNQQYRIDTNNIFVVGESAGGFVALNVGFMDTISEKSSSTYSLASVPPPASSTFSCAYNMGKVFTSANILRPDLGPIDGTIEPTTIKYKIKGIGNFYGAVTSNLFQYKKAGTTPPALYLYHQPCDLIVPFNSGKVDAGYSWCMGNCYSCFGISNTPTVFGSNYIKNLITNNSYPITIYNDMTSNQNPYNCIIGQWNCADQINNPCHEFDNYALRTNNMATFFASKITTSPICIPNFVPNTIQEMDWNKNLTVSPNPFSNELSITSQFNQELSYEILDMLGKSIYKGTLTQGINKIYTKRVMENGIYMLRVSSANSNHNVRIVCVNH